MRTFEQWMSAYEVSHKNKTNILIHKLCVPLIMFSVIGLLWSIPFPIFSYIKIPYLNWATLFVFFCLMFYLKLSFRYALGMTFQSIAMIVILVLLDKTQINTVFVSLTIFILAWVAQFIGHKIEGKKPSFLEDLAFLLIGPLWVLRFFYQKIGI